jgi:glycosyltransferase involved in cell wall biosynthesis
VAVTESTKQFMIDNYGVTPTDVAVIPLGADTSLFSHLADRRDVLRRELGYRDVDVVFLYAGKMVSSKGIDILVEGALEAMERDSSVKVLLVGDGPQDFTRMLAARIEAAGRTAGFTWHRPVPNSQLPDLFSAADVGVWPARSSLAMIEAQSCGLPIVVSSFPAAAERVHAGNGLIFEEGDASGLANAMLELLDTSRRREMGRRGRSLVERDRDYTVLSDRFLALASVGPAGVEA